MQHQDPAEQARGEQQDAARQDIIAAFQEGLFDNAYRMSAERAAGKRSYPVPPDLDRLRRAIASLATTMDPEDLAHFLTTTLGLTMAMASMEIAREWQPREDDGDPQWMERLRSQSSNVLQKTPPPTGESRRPAAGRRSGPSAMPQ